MISRILYGVRFSKRACLPADIKAMDAEGIDTQGMARPFFEPAKMIRRPGQRPAHIPDTIGLTIYRFAVGGVRGRFGAAIPFIDSQNNKIEAVVITVEQAAELHNLDKEIRRLTDLRAALQQQFGGAGEVLSRYDFE